MYLQSWIFLKIAVPLGGPREYFRVKYIKFNVVVNFLYYETKEQANDLI